jgi:hypothetical protein
MRDLPPAEALLLGSVWFALLVIFMMMTGVGP